MKGRTKNIKSKFYSKYLFVILFLVLAIFLSGCSGVTTPPINQAPIITSTPITTATVDVLYTYDVDATDPDGDTLTYSLTTSPAGMTITSTTGLINWTPTAAGDYDVMVEVSDGDLSDTQSFIITVTETPNQSPTASFTAVTTTAVVGPESVHFVVHFDASSSNGSIVSYAWNFKDSDPNLFSNTGNGKIIDHTFWFSGNYNVELTVIDNKGATDSTTKTITLLPDDLEFIATIEELDTPEKIGNYMVENFTHEDSGRCKDTYILWKTQKGRCSCFARFATIIANYHGYETYRMSVRANYPGYGNTGHALGVYVEDGRYTYSSNQYYYSGIKFNTFEEIANDCCSMWTPPIELSGYCVWNYDCERVEESPNY